MKRLVFAIAVMVAGPFNHVAHADADVPVECFSSPEAVLEAYPGSHAVYTAHATGWTQSSKCWFAGKPAAKPKAKSRDAAAVAPAPPRRRAEALPPLALAQALPPQSRREVQGTYEENAAALRALMFGPDETTTDFETRFSAIGSTPTFAVWRRCFATPTWDLCSSST
jgi:hypothetical protein